MNATHTPPVRAGIIGCSGRMGQELIASARRTEGAAYAGGTSRRPAEAEAACAPVFATTAELCAVSDVLIDFSAVENAFAVLDAAKAHNTPVVCGVTGFTATEKERLFAYAEHLPLLYSANMSLGVNLLKALTKTAASILGEAQFDIEILEMHHKHKADAPSGTALALGEAAAAGRGVDLAEKACYAREGKPGARPQGEIGFATLRGGAVPGDHSVIFAGENEHITLSHSAKNRAIFADGAVRAALFLHGKPNGLYAMEDVLGL